MNKTDLAKVLQELNTQIQQLFIFLHNKKIVIRARLH